MAYNNRSTPINQPSNYEFIPFIKPQTFKPKEEYSGYVEIELINLDNLFIGSGISNFDGKSIFDTTMQENGKLIIPGASLKGAVRHISRAVSPSCIPDVEYNSVPSGYDKKCIAPSKNNNGDYCIVCDMFGMMSKASKVRFTDLVAENGKTVKIKVPPQFGPNKKSDKYKENNKYIGYKFYYTECEERDILKNITIEAVEKKTSFKGKVFFKNLSKEELQLLMFSLTFSKLISIKLGKFKADGFGTCNIYCKKLVINGKEEDIEKAHEYAINHENYIDSIAEGQIDDIADILSRGKL